MTDLGLSVSVLRDEKTTKIGVFNIAEKNEFHLKRKKSSINTK